MEDGVPEGEDPAPAGEDPVAVPAVGRRQAGDLFAAVQLGRVHAAEVAGVAEVGDVAEVVDDPVPIGARGRLDMHGGGRAGGEAPGEGGGVAEAVHVAPACIDCGRDKDILDAGLPSQCFEG